MSSYGLKEYLVEEIIKYMKQRDEEFKILKQGLSLYISNEPFQHNKIEYCNSCKIYFKTKNIRPIYCDVCLISFCSTECALLYTDNNFNITSYTNSCEKCSTTKNINSIYETTMTDEH